jgi:hypothetical protein
MVGGVELMGYVFLLSFGLFSLGIGAVTAKYGSGVSRTIGIITACVGLVFLGIFGMVTCEPAEVFTFTVVAGLGAFIGSAAGMGIFLVSIMKS